MKMAARRLATANAIDGTPMTSMASISSLTRIAPSSATMPPPTFAATMKPTTKGTISRFTQNELNSGPTTPAPICWLNASAAMPQLTPATNAISTITRTLPAARIPT